MLKAGTGPRGQRTPRTARQLNQRPAAGCRRCRELLVKTSVARAVAPSNCQTYTPHPPLPLRICKTDSFPRMGPPALGRFPLRHASKACVRAGCASAAVLAACFLLLGVRRSLSGCVHGPLPHHFAARRTAAASIAVLAGALSLTLWLRHSPARPPVSRAHRSPRMLSDRPAPTGTRLDRRARSLCLPRFTSLAHPPASALLRHR